MNDYWLGKTILITGGTGFMGRLLISELLKEGVEYIISLSRGWDKSEKLERKMKDSRLITVNGDIRDVDFIQRVFYKYLPDTVIHAAAYKSLPSAEKNPLEATSINVSGTINLLDAAIFCGTKKFCFISTDKACSPVNTYGKGKSLSESIVSNAANEHFNSFSVRYGNVVGSTGSVFDVFRDSDVYRVTNPNMTRFWFRPHSAARFVLDSFQRAKGGEIFVPELKSSTMQELAESFCRVHKKKEIEIVGARSGEKVHEKMISSDEIENTFYFPNVYNDKGVFAIINDWGNAIPSLYKSHNVFDNMEFTSNNASRYTNHDLDSLVLEYLSS